MNSTPKYITKPNIYPVTISRNFTLCIKYFRLIQLVQLIQRRMVSAILAFTILRTTNTLPLSLFRKSLKILFLNHYRTWNPFMLKPDKKFRVYYCLSVKEFSISKTFWRPPRIYNTCTSGQY